MATIKELEEKFDEKILEVFSDYIESCHRTDNHDKDDNIRYFMKENNLDSSEYDELSKLYDEIDC